MPTLTGRSGPLLAAIAVAVTACTGGGPASAGASSSTTASASVSSASVEASASAAPVGHPAAGLVFVRHDDPSSPLGDIVVVEDDGSLRVVTGGLVPAGSWPQWSPDRSQIAFGPPKVGAGTSPQVVLVNADGTGERPIGEGQRATWSPDGRYLAYTAANLGQGPAGISILEVATGELVSIENANEPQWLPDGRISYQTTVEGQDPADPAAVRIGLFVRSVEGGEPQQIAVDSTATWSPDGTAMLFVHEGQVLLAEPDGTDAELLVSGYLPAWSPDGSRIAYVQGMTDEAMPLWAVIDREAEELWSGASGSSVAWSPDGERIAVDVAYPEPLIQVVDAASGEVLWETEGTQPDW